MSRLFAEMHKLACSIDGRAITQFWRLTTPIPGRFGDTETYWAAMSCDRRMAIARKMTLELLPPFHAALKELVRTGRIRPRVEVDGIFVPVDDQDVFDLDLDPIDLAALFATFCPESSCRN